MSQPTFHILQVESISAEVICVELVPELTIRIDDGGRQAIVVFESPRGLRVLDERDLTSFWAAGISSRVGWLFEITYGGWLDQESQRADFVSQHIGEQREYLVIGIDWCVSVIAAHQPRVEWSDVA